jgi:hypothetical protein
LVEWTASWNVQESILSMLERIWVTSSWNMVYRRTLWHEHMRNVNQRQRTSARFLVGNKICRTWHLFILPSSCIRMLLIQRIHCCSLIYVQESICTIFRQKVYWFLLWTGIKAIGNTVRWNAHAKIRCAQLYISFLFCSINDWWACVTYRTIYSFDRVAYGHERTWNWRSTTYANLFCVDRKKQLIYRHCSQSTTAMITSRN